MLKGIIILSIFYGLFLVIVNLTPEEEPFLLRLAAALVIGAVSGKIAADIEERDRR